MARFKDYWNKYIKQPILTRIRYLGLLIDKIPKNVSDSIIDILNYIFNAALMTFVIYTIMHKYYYNPIILCLDITIFIIFFEHYYCYLRRDWDKKTE